MQVEKTQSMLWWQWVCLGGCLTFFILQTVFSSPLKSAAFDEEYHITAGYAYLRTGDVRMSLSHPPLINLFSSLPLLWLDTLQMPTDNVAWQAKDYFLFSDVFLWQANDNPQQIVVWARWPIIVLGSVLVMILFFWTRRAAGLVAAWLVVMLAVFDPNLLTNARLVTTDLGLSCFLVLTLWRVWCWLKRPFWFNSILVGLLCGLTMTTKFTGLMVWPMLLIVLWVYPGYQHRRWLHFLAWLPLAYFALWAVYGFDVGPVPSWSLPISIPAPFYPHSLWDTFMVIEEQPKPSFLLGQISERGWWYYFPVVLAVKTPLPTLILAIWGAVQITKQKQWRETAVFWVPLLLYLGLAMTGRIAIGYRHILPILPFILMMAGYTLRQPSFQPRQNKQLLFISLLILWQIVGTLRLWPHQEAFFNELAGGPTNGHRVLVDSNIDWGQDLISLRQLMTEQNIDWVYLSYFGTALPEAYNIAYRPLPGFLRFTAGPEIDAYNPYTPPPGWYAISVTSLRLGLLLQNVDMYTYFQDKEPVARAGYSIYLYRVDYPPQIPINRQVIVGQSVSDISTSQLNLQPAQRLITKWVKSDDVAIIPATEPYIPPGQSTNVSFADAFHLISYELDITDVQPGQPLPLTLYWQVGTVNINTPSPSQAAPLAAFVHLSAEDPSQIVSQYDGWETALMGLELGDTIRHPLQLLLPPDITSGDYYIRLGLYSPQSGQRLPIVGPQPADYTTLPITITIP